MKWPIIISLTLLIAAQSCMDDSDWYELNEDGLRYDTLFLNNIEKQSGVFVLNEGNFMWDNASLSYYLIDSMKVYNEVFLQTNKAPLGDVGNSIEIRDSLAYIVLNNSNKIYVININTFKFVGKITDLTSPRHIHFLSDEKAYVSDLYSKAITIVDPSSFEVTGMIDIDNGNKDFYQHTGEEMLSFGKYVFCNSWSFDNKILVIDSETDRLVDSIEVVIQPNSMVLDRYNKLWVLSDGGYSGNPYGHEEAALTRIDAASLKIEKVIYFDLDDHPSELCINGTFDTLYFLNRDVWRHPVNSPVDPNVIIQSGYEASYTAGYYGLSINPSSGEIYVADAMDHSRRGSIYRYSPSGKIIDTFNVGISPKAFCFRK